MSRRWPRESQNQPNLGCNEKNQQHAGDGGTPSPEVEAAVASFGVNPYKNPEKGGTACNSKSARREKSLQDISEWSICEEGLVHERVAREAGRPVTRQKY